MSTVSSARTLRKRIAVVGTLVAGLFLVFAGTAAAHPLGNFTVNRYDGLVVARGELRVDHVEDLAEIPTAQIDPGARTPEKLPAWADARCATAAREGRAEVNGRAVALRAGASRAEIRPGQAGLATLRLECELTAALPDGEAAVSFRAPGGDGGPGWREVTARGDRMTLAESDAPRESLSRRLSTYPEDRLASPPDRTKAALRVVPGGPALAADGDERGAGPASVLPRGADRWTQALTGLVERRDLTLPFAALALATAIALGAMHALAPGHGKTLMAAAAAAGGRNSVREVLTLGISVTVTHTLGVFALGALVAAGSAAAPSVVAWLGVASGALVALAGAALVLRAWRRRGGPHHHHHHGHGHAHDHGGTDAPGHDHGHAHSPGTHTATRITATATPIPRPRARPAGREAPRAARHPAPRVRRRHGAEPLRRRRPRRRGRPGPCLVRLPARPRLRRGPRPDAGRRRIPRRARRRGGGEAPRGTQTPLVAGSSPWPIGPLPSVRRSWCSSWDADWCSGGPQQPGVELALSGFHRDAVLQRMGARVPENQLIAGRYRLLSPLGEGGMGVVWRARDEVLAREVAVKEVRAPAGLGTADERRLYQRLEREAWAAGRISHRNVVTVYDVATEDGRPWIVMELVRGLALSDVLEAEGPLSPQRAAHVGAEVLAALRAAHEAGVLHRDVKPGNVLVANDGRVVLTDFGIATVEGTSNLTMTGELIGSPEFLAPERALGRNPGPESDLWSLGVLLYAAVEGITPFRQNTPLSTLRAVVDEELPPPAPGR